MLIHHRDEVFVPGGQPTITYIDREEHQVERMFARALATPNQIVSLSGPTKTGKTVLCKKMLGSRSFVWVDSGSMKSSEVVWEHIQSELNIPYERSKESGEETEIGIEGSIPLITTANGSVLSKFTTNEVYKVNSIASALEKMLKEKVALVIDDFHYLPKEVQTEVMRTVKGAVFNGLKVVLLSVSHRIFEALNAESELTGRFISVALPNWSKRDLIKIPDRGFNVLNTECPESILNTLCEEAQENPFLMQKFCWEICFDCGIEKNDFFKKQKVPPSYDLNSMFISIAKDAGLPIYKKLMAGPQSRKLRAKRPLRTGGEVDIYEAILIAIANTGPKAKISYDEVRSELTALLQSMVPQKHEVTAALKHLAKIAREARAESAIDWDEDTREVTVSDPYLRFYLRWQVNKPED